MTEILAVEYEYGVDDYVAYSLHFMRTNPKYRRQRLLSRVVLPVALTVIGILMLLFSQRVSSIALVYFLMVAAYTAYVWLWYYQVSKRNLVAMVSAGRNRAMFGHTRIELRPDALWRSSPMSEGWVQWQGIESVERTVEHVFIAIGVSAAYVVPRRAFVNDTAFEAFIARATELWRAAQTA